MSGLVAARPRPPQRNQKKAPIAPRATEAEVAAVLANVAELCGPATTLPQRYREAYGVPLDARALGFGKLGSLLAVGERRGLFAVERTARREDGTSGSWCLRPVGAEVTHDASDGESVGLLGFYHYARPPWTEPARDATAAWLRALCAQHRLGGRVRVATEGVNATVSGSSDGLDAFQATLSTTEGWHSVLFKREPCTPQQLWPALSCWLADELCGFGADEATRSKLDAVGPGIMLEPRAFRERMMEKDAVLVDVRNAYETNIGAFPGALDPKTRTFSDFQTWLEKDETRSALKGKDVLMYCTGGVRCERATAALRAAMPENKDRVFHLKGGIVSYMDEGLEGFAGANYVFDRRNRHGAAPRGSDEVLGKCLACRTPWDVYRGSATCAKCKVRVLLCDACLSSRDHEALVCELCAS